MQPVRALWRLLIGKSKSRVCGNRYYDYNSDYSICVSQGLLERWKDDETLPSPSPMKRVVIVVDEWREAKVALLWALSHVLNSSHTLTLLHIQNDHNAFPCSGSLLLRKDENAERISMAESLEGLCKSYCPEVQVEVVMTEGGDKRSSVVKWAKKLEASMLVVGQKKPPLFDRVFGRKEGDLADFCIANAECLTVGVRKRSSRIGGYIINSREVKNFWLLA